MKGLGDLPPTPPKEGSTNLHELIMHYELCIMNYKMASPDPLLSSFRSLNEQRPTVPKEGSTNL